MIYDEPRLVAILATLPPHERLVFATACVIRLRPYFAYEAEEPLRSALDETVAVLVRYARGDSSHSELADAIAVFERACDVDDEAVAAVIYAFRALGDNGAQSAAWAARNAYNACDRQVISALGIDINAAGAEQRILADPVIQEELARHVADLQLLREPGGSTHVLAHALTGTNRAI
jgi:hypothetical protein